MEHTSKVVKISSNQQTISRFRPTNRRISRFRPTSRQYLNFVQLADNIYISSCKSMQSWRNLQKIEFLNNFVYWTDEIYFRVMVRRNLCISSTRQYPVISSTRWTKSIFRLLGGRLCPSYVNLQILGIKM